ncbi:MAG: HAD family phosphatase [Clostridiales bacterium]|nr:HAD family phosphatase [Clostridiales bacterium]
MLPFLSELKGKADALIFDVDGTLLDSMTVWNQADTVFLNSRGFEVTPDYTDYVKSVRIEDAAVYTKERYGLPDSVDDIMNEWNSFVNRAYASEVPLKGDAYNYLVNARKLGFRIACATALTRPNLDAAFGRLNIRDMFDVITTLEDLPGYPDKSEPDIYLHVAKLLRCEPERTVVFEDVPVALNGAAKGGFITCAVWDEVGAGSEEAWARMEASSSYSFKIWSKNLKD